MLKFFSTGYLSRYVAVFFLFVLFWIPAFLFPSADISSAFPFYSFLDKSSEINPYYFLTTALILTILSSLIINQLASDFEFSSRFSSLGLFFFTLFSSSILSFYSLNPILLANIFLLFFLRYIFQFPTTNVPITGVFNAGLLLGIASLFFTPLLLLVLFLWSAIIAQRLNDWRNFASSLIGVIVPYLFLFTWYLWAETLIENYENIVSLYIFIPDFQFSEFSINYLIIIFFMFVIIVSSLNTFGRLREKNIHLRRNLMITLLYLVFAISLAIFYHKMTETLLLIAIPATLILTNSAYQSKKLKFFNWAIYVLLLLIFLNIYLSPGKFIISSL